MIQINLGDHVSTEPGWTGFPRRHRHTVLWARERAFWIARNIRAANPYFYTLGRRRTLTSLLNDSSLWINFEDTEDYYGAMENTNSREMCITPVSLRPGRWMTVATMIHELAHVAGADGRHHDAELAVLICGLGRRSEYRTKTDDTYTPYAPGITG